MISEFKDEYRWLSNFAPVKICIYGETYSSVEHAYMAFKSDDPEWRLYCQSEATAGQVKRASRTINVKDNWEQIKVHIMLCFLTKKFEQEPFRTKLLETNDELLQEGNNWGDKFWGVCLKTNTGKNMLGQLIMGIRIDIFNELDS